MGKFITDELREKMAKDVSVNDTNVDKFLLDHTLILARYIQQFTRVATEYKKLKKDYDEFYTEKWSYYRFKHEYDTSERDATKLTEGDKEVTQKRFDLESCELEVKELQDYIDIFKWKHQSVKTWLELQKFKAGV